MNNDPKDIKYGLVVVDMNQSGEYLDVLHFVGYWNPPTQHDVDSLREELATDETFGLTQSIDNLEIIPAPPDIIEHCVKILIDLKNEEDGVVS